LTWKGTLVGWAGEPLSAWLGLQMVEDITVREKEEERRDETGSGSHFGS